MNATSHNIFYVILNTARKLCCDFLLLPFLSILNFIGQSIQIHFKSQWAGAWHATWLARCKFLFKIWQKSWLKYRAAKMLESFAKLRPKRGWLLLARGRGANREGECGQGAILHNDQPSFFFFKKKYEHAATIDSLSFFLKFFYLKKKDISEN